MYFLRLTFIVAVSSFLVACASVPDPRIPTPATKASFAQFQLKETPSAHEALVYVINRPWDMTPRSRSVYVKVGNQSAFLNVGEHTHFRVAPGDAIVSAFGTCSPVSSEQLRAAVDVDRAGLSLSEFFVGNEGKSVSKKSEAVPAVLQAGKTYFYWMSNMCILNRYDGVSHMHGSISASPDDAGKHLIFTTRAKM